MLNTVRGVSVSHNDHAIKEERDEGGDGEEKKSLQAIVDQEVKINDQQTPDKAVEQVIETSNQGA